MRSSVQSSGQFSPKEEVAVECQLNDNPQIRLSLLDIYYALFYGHLLLFHNCRNLGGRDIYLGLTRKVVNRAPKGPGHPPAITLAEALSLMRSPEGDIGPLYEAMQLDLGTLMEGDWDEEPRSPLCTDPRPDLHEDSELWEQLLALAVEKDEELAEALFAIRWGGSRLVMINGQYAIRPQIGPGCWLKKEDYEDVRDIWLTPKKEQVAELLRRLKAASPKAS